jgi:alpha-tubulin suppressor-like RCC1 family protein
MRRSSNRFFCALLLIFSGGIGASQGSAAELRDIARIATSSNHTCALTTAGGVKCWGDNSSRQIGDISISRFLTPEDVPGLLSGVAAIAVGGAHSCVLTTAGGVKCWGADDYDQLGDNSRTYQASPVDVKGLSSGITAIAAGAVHTCALTTEGGVKCWGWNYAGQLGDNSAHRLLPVDVTGLSSGVTAIATGSQHSCALIKTGGVRCWGENQWGALGNNSTTHSITPVEVSGLSSGVLAIAAGGNHTCALTTAGGVKCWGENISGELSDHSSTNRLTPVDVAELPSGVVAIAVGYFHTCALSIPDGVLCWGNNTDGQVGDSYRSYRIPPMALPGLDGTVTAIAAGTAHSCALTKSGGVTCWGGNKYGQLGDGTGSVQIGPVTVAASPRPAVEFYNAALDHYFMTADADEAAAIDNGAAGAGWTRTGETFKTGGSSPVCRFYGSQSPGPNAHFYTVAAAECQTLKDIQFSALDPRRLTVKSWNFESLDFVSITPVCYVAEGCGQCPQNTVPVYRAYNDGFARGVDSNHRLSSSQVAIAQVVARGWIKEGVVMCARF